MKNRLKSKLLLAICMIYMLPYSVFAGVQTGGGYKVIGDVNPVTSLTSGNGYTSHAGGSAISSKVTGGGYSVYGHPFYIAPAAPTGATTLTGGGGGGGNCPMNDKTCRPQASSIALATPSCKLDIKIANPIRYGLLYKNNPEDVKIVEQFLNEFEGEKLTVDGKYSRSDEAAVIRWQEKYADAILIPWGIKSGTGYVFTTSIAQMKRQQAAKCDKEIPVEEVVIPSARACAADIKIANPIRFGVIFKNNPQDVKIVEQFLNDFEGEKLTVDGKYSRGDEAAVIRWQEKYSPAVLAPWGLKRGTGYVFTTSIAQMKRQQIDRCDPTKKFHVPIPDVRAATASRAIPASLNKLNSTNIAVNNTSCPYFTEYQSLGARNLEVLKIQSFLNTYMKAGIEETGFYGIDTETAVKAFQNKYSSEILSSWGIDFPASGWWFKSTRKKANELVGCTDGVQLFGGNNSPVGQ